MVLRETVHLTKTQISVRERKTATVIDLRLLFFQSTNMEETDMGANKDHNMEKCLLENERLRRQCAEMQEEVAMLRKIVLNRLTGDEPDTECNDSISFPYTVQHRVVVFGGHDTWSKAIRPMLKNVRFVERNTQPNRDMIKNADVVWIQVNALGHKHYLSLIHI